MTTTIRKSADMPVGTARLATEMQEKERNVAAQNTIAEMVCYAQIIRMGPDYVCKHYETTPSGMIHSNILAVNATKYCYASNYHDMIRNIRDLDVD